MLHKNLLFAILLLACLSASGQQTPNYNLAWNSQSANSSESMPCGGGDIGLNVWVENGDVLFYIARSGIFDENNSMLKLGRVRIQLSPNPFEGRIFRQELNLNEGCVLISGKNSQNVATDVRTWVDVFNPVIHVEVSNNQKLSASIFYENWRYEDRPLRIKETRQGSYEIPPIGLVTKKDDNSVTNGMLNIPLSSSNLISKLKSVAGKSLHFTFSSEGKTSEYTPYYAIDDETFTCYPF